MKALGVISIIAFIVFALVCGGIFILDKITLTTTMARVNGLKMEVEAQETSEQQLVLLKDRLAKIATFRKTPNASKNISGVDTLFANQSPNTIMNQAGISSTKVDISLVIKTNEDLTAFLNTIKGTKLFSSVDLSTLSFSPLGGYSVAVSLGNK